MRYQGGKTLSAKNISKEILLRKGDADTFVSLFCGACSVEARLAPHFNKVICNDNHEYLIALLKGVQDGYELPDSISREQYKYIRDNKDEDKVLTGFVGFGCSFGAKWFGGYAYNSTNRNYASESKRALLRDNEYLKNVEFTCKDYRDVELPSEGGCIVYADPPYYKTTQYSTGDFDTNAFWNYMREISQSHLVFISELEAPEDFVPIWEKPVTRVIDVNKSNYFQVCEKLYIHKKYIEER